MYRDLYGKGKVKGNEKLTYGTETSRSKCNKINNENRHLFTTSYSLSLRIFSSASTEYKMYLVYSR